MKPSFDDINSLATGYAECKYYSIWTLIIVQVIVENLL